MEKAGYVENQDISYLNSDTIVAEGVAANYHFSATSIFSMIMGYEYKLKPEDIFNAILNLNLNRNEFIIVSMGLHLPYYTDILKIDRLVHEIKTDTYTYDGIKIVTFHNYMHDFVRQSLFLLKKIDLPNFLHLEISLGEREKYKLEELDKINHIYASILDLSLQENETIKAEIKVSSDKNDLTKSALVCVQLVTEIRWNIKSKCIQLRAFSQFDDRDNPDDLKGIKNIWDEKNTESESK